jgi:adenosylmethionine-8-amino-7-oxononanoate aminotransferase
MLGLSHPPAIKLAEQLIKIVPKGLTRVFYSDDGSTAMEIALKMAFQFWRQSGSGRTTHNAQRKTRYLTLTNAYHGDTIGSVSLGGIELFHSVYKPLLFSTIRVPAPYCYRCFYQLTTNNCPSQDGGYHDLRCLKEVERAMKHHRDELAALVIEPLIQCAAGMLTHPRGFLKAVRRLCTKYNVLMIADEVATGFGRTGRMFACQHEGVTPDIMAVAKGITGGYLPLAATFTTERIFNAFLGEPDENKTFFHGHTYTGNPLACAAALASLEIFRKEQTLQKLQPKIKLLTRGLRRFYNLPAVGDIRQCGFMVGIELVRNRLRCQPYPPERRVGHQVILEARRQGVILRPLGDVIVLMPPLVISQKELERLLTVTYWSIEKVTEQLE